MQWSKCKLTVAEHHVKWKSGNKSPVGFESHGPGPRRQRSQSAPASHGPAAPRTQPGRPERLPGSLCKRERCPSESEADQPHCPLPAAPLPSNARVPESEVNVVKDVPHYALLSCGWTGSLPQDTGGL